MSFKIVKKVPTGAEIIKQIPLAESVYRNIEKHREEIRDILIGHDNRLLIIIGPCSAWPYNAVLEYADKLVKVNEIIKDKLKIVMRSYIRKPRTIGGWAGPLHQPDLLASPNIEQGMYYARKLMVEISNRNLAIADEAVFTNNAHGFLEMLSWVAIGARSTENQEHRIFASSLDCPVGMKNPTSGSVKTGINGVIAAQQQHIGIFDGYEIETSGNPYAHLVLRGGSSGSNCKLHHLEQIKHYFEVSKIKNPSVIVDVSHDNCLINGVKEYKKQGDIMFEVLNTLKQNPQLSKMVKGFMLESFIKEGRQDIKDASSIDLNGLSITDPCIGWEHSEEILFKLASM